MSPSVQNPDTASPARAAIGAAVTARLEATPGIKRVRSDSADVYRHADFVTDGECAALIALIDAGRRPSTLLSTTVDPNFRTSESCDLDRFSPIVEPIDRRIAALLGIASPHAETMQGQRYERGQQFRAHHDYFLGTKPYWPQMKSEGGQRTWTAMIYLNDVEDGGATWFPQAGIRVPPRKRLLLTWNNMNADGSPNRNTLHEGMPVTRGVKYIVTKWFREGHWLR